MSDLKVGTMPRIRRRTATGIVAALVFVVASCAPPPPPPGTYVVRSRLHTAFELAPYNGWISRDCGYSRSSTNPTTGVVNDFWVFCDTTMNSNFGTFVGRGSAADTNSFTPGTVPTLGDHPSPGAPFLPNPGGVCSNGAVPLLWTQGLGASRNGSFRIYYISECPNPPVGGVETLAWGSVLWNPFTQQFSDNQRTTFTYSGVDLPPQKELMSPIERGGYTYFTAHLTNASLTMARVPTGSETSSGAYQWYAGLVNGQPNWSAAYTAAAAIPNLEAGGMPSVDFYPSLPGSPYVMIIQTKNALAHGTTAFSVYQTTTPENPASWSLKAANLAPEVCKQGHWCYAFIGHPELSTSNQILISHFDNNDYPAGQNTGHISVGAVGW